MARTCSMAWRAPYMDLGVLIDSFRVRMHAACVLFMLSCDYCARAHRFWDRQDAAVPDNAGDAGLGRSDPPWASLGEVSRCPSSGAFMWVVVFRVSMAVQRAAAAKIWVHATSCRPPRGTQLELSADLGLILTAIGAV